MSDSTQTAAMNAALDEMAAARFCAMQVSRAGQALGDAPDVDRAAAATRFASPAATRLRRELTGMADAVRDAGRRIDKLVRLLTAAANEAEQRADRLSRAVPGE
jgi:hypothetical protein